ncbi:MAG: cytochrome C oxidase subunit IV family protein [Candidatus Marinimicrobia bacterium]|nr:cytochrome C oxidase subunit IV family protein [Candidatus Neomarinimicrobiota bacterium]
MTSDSHSEPNYMRVFWWLLFLTILEIIIAVIPNGPLYSNLFQGFLLITTAVSKATLVALYFMHLKFEKRILGAIAFSPLILMAIALTLLLSDIRVPEPKAGEMSRSNIESMMEE